MVGKLAKKTLKTSILLGLKEAYLFFRNLQGLLFHPFKTFQVMKREKDKLQVFLIFGLPFYMLITGFIFIILGRFLIQAPPQWGFFAKLLFFLLSLLSLLIFVYLFYWLVIFLKKTKKINDFKN